MGAAGGGLRGQRPGLVLSAIFLAEDVSLVKVGGMVLVIGGVVLLSVAD